MKEIKDIEVDGNIIRFIHVHERTKNKGGDTNEKEKSMDTISKIEKRNSK